MTLKSWALVIVCGASLAAASSIATAQSKPGKSRTNAANPDQASADPLFDSAYRGLPGNEESFYVVGFKTGYGNADKSLSFRLVRGRTAAAQEIANFLRSGTKGRRWIIEPYSNEAAARAAFAAHVDYARRSGYR